MTFWSKGASPATQVVAIGIGAAIFFVLGRFVAIPSPIPNTSISLQYAALALLALVYGPLVAAIAGFVGHLLIDTTGYGLWISWEISTLAFGLIVGILLLRVNVRDGVFSSKDIFAFNGAIIVANAVAWPLIAPTLDVLIYAEPAGKVYTQGVFAFASNSVVTCLVGTLLAAVYVKTQTRTGSLKLED
ncbi:ECF-type riboflavin transporter substrate-binding protein [Dermabacteraceae bacterium CCM 9519]